jgi:guanylate kinase
MRVLVFLGPSGSGKSTVVRELQRRRVIAVTPSWTTRPRRYDEPGDTVEHRFVDDEAFARRARAGFFLEVVRMFGLPYAYGLPPVETPGDGRVPVIMVRAPLMPLVEHHFPDHVAYQVEDRFERVQARLEARTGDLGTRRDGYEDERRLGRAVAHRVFVNAGSIQDLVDAVALAVEEDFVTNTKEEPCPKEA